MAYCISVEVKKNNRSELAIAHHYKVFSDLLFDLNRDIHKKDALYNPKEIIEISKVWIALFSKIFVLRTG